MKYNFTKLIDRTGKDATALDGIGKEVWGFEPGAAKPGFDEIPMWVADMNFETCPAVTRALEERIRHPLYGYFIPSDAYYESIIHWQAVRHGWTEGLSREMIGYENGVHGGIISAIEVLTEPGDAVLVHSPTYVGFLGDLVDTGRKTVLSPLRHESGTGTWRMDFTDMEARIRKYHIHLAIFCSPHNPTGRVWERWEIEQAMDLFRHYNVTVISDEIWSDIIFAGHKHIPTATVSEDAASRTIALYAPSKTFNLAGMIGSYHIIPDLQLRERVTRHGDRTHYNEMNVLSMHALIGAYSDEGQAWTNELNQVLEENCRYAADFINTHSVSPENNSQDEPFASGCNRSSKQEDNGLRKTGKPAAGPEGNGIHITMPQGTYMLFAECGDYLKAHNMTLQQLLQKGWDVGIAWQDGSKFAWHDAIRLNTALPMSRLKEAMHRLETYVF